MMKRATQEATNRYRKEFGEGFFRKLGRTDLWVSAFGFGGYRVFENQKSHREALDKALRSGCNLIDTSSNYTSGSSERLVGQIIKSQQKISRDQIVVVSKVGYAQGENLDLLRSAQQNGKPFSDVVEYSPDCFHCIHPDFLEVQLTKSLERLGLETIDVYLLHNPEYFLSDAKNHGKTSLEDRRVEYEKRVELAFQWLEEQTEKGRIGSYGVSSNTFPAATNAPEHSSLERFYNIAQKVSSNHHFSTIQFPMNLAERGALLELNQAQGKQTILDFARENGLGVLINRPLNAIVNGALIRLADFPRGDREAIKNQIFKDLELAIQAETNIQSMITEKAGDSARQLVENLRVAEVVSSRWKHIPSIETWNDMLEYSFVPALSSLLRSSAPFFAGRSLAPIENYSRAVRKLFSTLTSYFQAMAQERIAKFTADLDPLLDESARPLSFSQKALWTLASLPQVSTVLVGMRKERYVDDVLGLRGFEYIKDADQIVHRFRGIP